MLTTEDFTTKFDKYSNQELFLIHKDINNYSYEAKQALEIILLKRGGLDLIEAKLQDEAVVQKEKRRVATETASLRMNGVDAEFLKKTTTSSILSNEELNCIIDTNVSVAEYHLEDKKIDSDTIMKSVLACGVASLFGGAFISLQFLYLGATSILMVIGLALICYGVVKWITKKSYNNVAVGIASLLAFVLSYLIGFFVYSIFGYLG